MTSAVVPLAHAGEGATWQALLTLLALGLALVFVLAVAGAVRLEEPGDLILPLAGVAVLASLSGATSSVLSDWVGWAFPLGVVALLGLGLAASTPMRLSLTSPLAAASVLVAVVGALAFQDTLTRAWHPTPETIDAAPLDDLAISITDPRDGATIPSGQVDLVVTATGGTLGNGFVDEGGPTDPEERVGLTLTLVLGATGETMSLAGDPVEDCADGCRQATYTLELPEPGTWQVFVEAKTADARPFTVTGGSAGSPTARIELEVS